MKERPLKISCQNRGSKSSGIPGNCYKPILSERSWSDINSLCKLLSLPDIPIIADYGRLWRITLVLHLVLLQANCEPNLNTVFIR